MLGASAVTMRTDYRLRICWAKRLRLAGFPEKQGGCVTGPEFPEVFSDKEFTTHALNLLGGHATWCPSGAPFAVRVRLDRNVLFQEWIV